MEKRIRYIKNSDGTITSMRVLKVAAGGDLRPVIETDGKRGKVLDAATGVVLKEVTGTSPHKVKIALKDALISLGVVFTDETRKKRAKDET